MQPNSKKPADVLSETAEHRIFDRQTYGGSPGVCSRDIRHLLYCQVRNLRAGFRDFVGHVHQYLAKNRGNEGTRGENWRYDLLSRIVEIGKAMKQFNAKIYLLSSTIRAKGVQRK